MFSVVCVILFTGTGCQVARGGRVGGWVQLVHGLDRSGWYYLIMLKSCYKDNIVVLSHNIFIRNASKKKYK